MKDDFINKENLTPNSANSSEIADVKDSQSENKKEAKTINLSHEISSPLAELSSKSRIGGRKENQDNCGAIETQYGLLSIVCDGMGGAKGGATASEMAVTLVANFILNNQSSSCAEVLTNAVKYANDIIYQKGMSTPDLRGMGTTIVAIIIDDNKATVAHVGDSRVYQVRGKNKIFRTFDHSMVFELVRRGSLTEEQARLSAESNVILRAIGTKPDIEVEINDSLPYLKGDRFLLCTDGICGAVNEAEILKLVACNRSIEECVETIASRIDNIGSANGGGHDNLTATLLEVKQNSKIKQKMSKLIKIFISALILIAMASLTVNALVCMKLNSVTNIVNSIDNVEDEKSKAAAIDSIKTVLNIEIGGE